MPFPDLSPFPVTSDPSTFDARMDALLAKLPTWGSYAEALAAAMTAVAAGGAVSLQYTFDTATADADPGAGKLRLNQAVQNTATVIRADLSGSDGPDLTNVLALIDDSTSTNKGYLTLRKSTDATKWLVFSVTSLASPSGYKNITVTCVASSAASPLANGDAILLDFTPTGDKGDTGLTGSDSWPAAAAGGTVDAITADFTPNIALTDMQACRVVLTGANTSTTPSFAPDGLPAHTITKKGGAALVAGDLPGVNAVALLQYNLANTRWELLNPQGTLPVIPVTNIVTATTATTLTSTPTLLQITPTSYGVAVTLPDATTCTTEGGPIHIIHNKGAYQVMVRNSAGTLLGFLPGGCVSHVSLIDNATAAGVWAVSNSKLCGVSAALLTTTLNYLANRNLGSVALDSDREFLFGYNAANTIIYGAVYRRSTNAFSAVTAIRTVSVNDNKSAAILQTTNQVLVVSCGTTDFEAVICSINASTDEITVNTPATATLSANITQFADSCGLIAVGTSFITSYDVATPTCQIREITVSGTTPTISAATVLDGTAGGLIVAGDATHVIAVSTATTHLYTKPYTIGGLAAGTGTDTNSGTMTLNKLAALGTRWFVAYNDGGTTCKGGVISLSGTTTTITTVTLFSAGTIQDAAVFSSTKVFLLNNQTTNNANILTDTAGTASAGTAITLTDETQRAALYTYGDYVCVWDGGAGGTMYAEQVNCSGASPVLSEKIKLKTGTQWMTSFSSSNSVLRRSQNALYGTSFAQPITQPSASAIVNPVMRRSVIGLEPNYIGHMMQTIGYWRGAADSERWVGDVTTIIMKIELAVGALT